MNDYVVFALLGVIIGSFFNVVIHRLPLMLQQEVEQYVAGMSGRDYDPSGDVNLMGRSMCPSCSSIIPWYHNVPLLSFLWLRGKCGSCGLKISYMYPLVELVSLVGAIGCAMYFGFTLEGGIAFIALMLIVSLSVIDLKHMILPDSLVLGLLALGLANEIYVWDAIKLVDRIEGIVLVFIVMYLFRGAMNKVYGQEAFGMGDVKLLAALAAWMPAYMLIWVVLFASLSLLLVTHTSKSTDRVSPFGPYLCFGALLTYFNQSPLYMVMF